MNKANCNYMSDEFTSEDKIHVFNDYSIPKGLIDLVKVDNEIFDHTVHKKSVNLDKLLRKTSAKRNLFMNTIKSKSFKYSK